MLTLSAGKGQQPLRTETTIDSGGSGTPLSFYKVKVLSEIVEISVKPIFRIIPRDTVLPFQCVLQTTCLVFPVNFIDTKNGLLIQRTSMASSVHLLQTDSAD